MLLPKTESSPTRDIDEMPEFLCHFLRGVHRGGDLSVDQLAETLAQPPISPPLAQAASAKKKI